MSDLAVNPLGIPNFDMSQHIAADRQSEVPHISEDGSITAGAYSRLLFEKQQTYRPEDGRFYEYPKCVTFGKFNGVARDAAHEAELKAKYSPVAPPAGGQGNQAPRPAGAPAAQGQSQRH